MPKRTVEFAFDIGDEVRHKPGLSSWTSGQTGKVRGLRVAGNENAGSMPVNVWPMFEVVFRSAPATSMPNAVHIVWIHGSELEAVVRNVVPLDVGAVNAQPS